ncbi:MAG: FkbM family methyltransferase [Phycisphaerales bacterium]
MLHVVRRYFNLPASVWRHLHFEGVIDASLPNGQAVKLHHFGALVENEIFWTRRPGGVEWASMELWMRLCPHARCIVDIGANSGIYALYAKAINPSARVLAIEPLPGVLTRLVQNVRANDLDIDVVPCALSDADGVAIVYEPEGASHVYSVTVNDNLNDDDAPVVASRVMTRRFDSLAVDLGIDLGDGPFLMKLDVETHEPAVLDGLGRFLKKGRPILQVEVLNDDVADSIQQILGALDYRFFDIDDATGWLTERPTVQRSSFWNVLAIPQEQSILFGHVCDELSGASLVVPGWQHAGVEA